jgi:hypothetical protein
MAKENSRAGREQRKEKMKEKVKEKMAKEKARAEREQREKKRKMADSCAKEKEARDRGLDRSGPGLARNMRRADTHAQEAVDTHTHAADSNRSNDAPKTGRWTCAAVQEDRIRQNHPDLDPDMDPGQRQCLANAQGGGNEEMVIELSNIQTTPHDLDWEERPLPTM